jgi:hypothetical protein
VSSLVNKTARQGQEGDGGGRKGDRLY